MFIQTNGLDYFVFRKKQNTFVYVAFIFILLADVIVRLNSFIGISNGSTELVAALNFLSVFGLLAIAKNFGIKSEIPKNGLLFFRLFVLWNVISFLRGAMNASDYWDWKMLLLNYLFSILVPLAIVAGVHFEFLIKTIRFILDRLFLLGFALIPIALTTDSELYARIMMAVSLFVLFIPYLKQRWRLLVVLVAILSIAVDLSYRVNILRVMFPFFLLAIFLYRRAIPNGIFNFVLSIMLLTPLLLLYLGVNNVFNVFTDSVLDIFNMEVVTVGGGEVGMTALSADTRTFLYREVFGSMAYKDSSFLFGEGGVSGYLTDYFESTALNDRGRYLSEVGFLNTVLYSGTVGVFLYMLMLFIPAYYAINKSNNFLCKTLGLFLAYHWIIFFIEDITKFDVNYFCIWVTIGLCLSNKFRSLSDNQIKQFFKLDTTLTPKKLNRHLSRSQVNYPSFVR